MAWYEWLKVIHIVSAISWMVGLLYLPRLMVYHSVSTIGSEQSETFKIMERRLLKGIMTPAMISTWLFGLGLASILDAWLDVWFVIKLILVVTMTIMHFFLSSLVRVFARDANQRSQGFFRLINEGPTLLMIFIVILVVVKPF